MYDFYDPVQDIVTKIDGDEITYSEKIRKSVTDKYADSIDWYDNQSSKEEPESSWKQYVGPALTGMMLTAGAIGAYNQMSSASRPNVNVAASGLEVDDQAVSAQTIDTSAPLIDVSDVEVVHQPSVAEPQVIVSAPDAVDLMRAGTTTGTKVVLPVGQSYGPRPTLGESVKNMVTGNTPPAFYDPVQHSGFDINKVQETKQAEEKIASEKRQAEDKQMRAEQQAMKILKPEEIEVLTARIREREKLPANAEITELERSLDMAGNPTKMANGRATYVDKNGCTITINVAIPISGDSIDPDWLARQEQTIKLRDLGIAKFEKENPSIKRFTVSPSMDHYTKGADGEWVHDPEVMFRWNEEWEPGTPLRRLINRSHEIRVSPQEIANTGSSSWWPHW